MSPSKRDPRPCPRCGTRGISHIRKEQTEGGFSSPDQDPGMVCAFGGKGLTATGMTFLGVIDLRGMTREQLHDLAGTLNQRMVEIAEAANCENPCT